MPHMSEVPFIVPSAAGASHTHTQSAGSARAWAGVCCHRPARLRFIFAVALQGVGATSPRQRCKEPLLSASVRPLVNPQQNGRALCFRVLSHLTRSS